MAFKQILAALTQKSRASGAIMLDWEGEMVEMYSIQDDLQLDAIGAHKGIIFSLMKEVAKNHDPNDQVKTVTMKTTTYKIVLRALKDGYYVVIVMHRLAIMGQAIFELERASRLLEIEMG